MTWWQWPIWSPGRLMVTLAVIATIAIGVNLAMSGQAPSSAGPVASGQPVHEHGEEDTPPPDNPAQMAAATTLAERFVAAWTTPDPARRRVLLAPIATEQLIAGLTAVPAEQLAFTAVGPPTVTFTGPGRTTVEVPLSTGRRAILGMVSTPRGWLVETVAATMATP